MLRDVVSLQSFQRPIPSSAASASDLPKDTVGPAREAPPARLALEGEPAVASQPELSPLASRIERWGPVGGPLKYLQLLCIARREPPRETLEEALDLLEQQPSLPDPALRTLVGLAGQEKVKDAVSARLEKWIAAGRLPSQGDGPLHEAVVRDGRLDRQKPEFPSAWGMHDPEQAGELVSGLLEHPGAVDCEINSLLDDDEGKGKSRWQLLENHLSALCDACYQHEQRGQLQHDFMACVLSTAIEACGDKLPVVELQRSLGALIRASLDSVGLAVRSGLQVGGHSWALEQLSRRAENLPVDGLRELQTDLEKGRWHPTRGDAATIVSFLDLPRNQSVLDEPYSEALEQTARLLCEVHKRRPDLLQGLAFQDQLLERVLGDSTADRTRSARMFTAYGPLRDGPSLPNEALASVLFQTEGGDRRIDRALDELEKTLAPTGPLDERQARLCGLLDLAGLSPAQHARMASLLEGWPARLGADTVSDEVLRAHGRTALVRSLDGLSPRQTLTLRPQLEQQLELLKIGPSDLDSYLLRQWASYVSSDPSRELPQASHAVSGWPESAHELMPCFQEALEKDRLREMFGALEQCCVHGCYDGSFLLSTAYRKGGLDRAVLLEMQDAFKALREGPGRGFTFYRKAFETCLERPEPIGSVVRALNLVLPRSRREFEEAFQILDSLRDLSDERVERYLALSKVVFGLRDEADVIESAEKRADAGCSTEQLVTEATALRKELRLSGTEGFLALNTAASRLGGGPEAGQGCLELARDLKQTLPEKEYKQACLEAFKRVADGSSLSDARTACLSQWVGSLASPLPTASALEETAAQVRLPGVVVRKRSS